jgi:hypothetical protein
MAPHNEIWICMVQACRKIGANRFRMGTRYRHELILVFLLLSLVSLSLTNNAVTPSAACDPSMGVENE